MNRNLCIYHINSFARRYICNELKREPKGRGRFQWWTRPMEYTPYINPLQRGADFSFQDGRTIVATSKQEFDRRKDNAELGAKVVKLLGEIKEAQELSLKLMEKRRKEMEKSNEWKPKEKGDISI